MNKVIFVFLLLVSMIDYLQSKNSIIEDLQTNFNSSEGIIRIKGDSAIIALVDSEDNQTVLKTDQKFEYPSRFRIQVFMSNNSYTVRSEASFKQAAIKNVFPDLPTYLIYKSPNWRLLIGDFVNREKATLVMKQLQKKFPEFGKEMYVVNIRLALKESKQ